MDKKLVMQYQITLNCYKAIQHALSPIAETLLSQFQIQVFR